VDQFNKYVINMIWLAFVRTENLYNQIYDILY
jgi:hypothetical protein